MHFVLFCYGYILRSHALYFDLSWFSPNTICFFIYLLFWIIMSFFLFVCFALRLFLSFFDKVLFFLIFLLFRCSFSLLLPFFCPDFQKISSPFSFFLIFLRWISYSLLILYVYTRYYSSYFCPDDIMLSLSFFVPFCPVTFSFIFLCPDI